MLILIISLKKPKNGLNKCLNNIIMIKREFIENNLLKVLDYLPANFVANNKEYLIFISKLYCGQ